MDGKLVWALLGLGTKLRTIKKEADLKGLSGAALAELNALFRSGDNEFPDNPTAQKDEAVASVWRDLVSKLGARESE